MSTPTSSVMALAEAKTSDWTTQPLQRTTIDSLSNELLQKVASYLLEAENCIEELEPRLEIGELHIHRNHKTFKLHPAFLSVNKRFNGAGKEVMKRNKFAFVTVHHRSHGYFSNVLPIKIVRAKTLGPSDQVHMTAGLASYFDMQGPSYSITFCLISLKDFPDYCTMANIDYFAAQLEEHDKLLPADFIVNRIEKPQFVRNVILDQINRGLGALKGRSSHLSIEVEELKEFDIQQLIALDAAHTSAETRLPRIQLPSGYFFSPTMKQMVVDSLQVIPGQHSFYNAGHILALRLLHFKINGDVWYWVPTELMRYYLELVEQAMATEDMIQTLRAASGALSAGKRLLKEGYFLSDNELEPSHSHLWYDDLAKMLFLNGLGRKAYEVYEAIYKELPRSLLMKVKLRSSQLMLNDKQLIRNTVADNMWDKLFDYEGTCHGVILSLSELDEIW